MCTVTGDFFVYASYILKSSSAIKIIEVWCNDFWPGQVESYFLIFKVAFTDGNIKHRLQLGQCEALYTVFMALHIFKKNKNSEVCSLR